MLQHTLVKDFLHQVKLWLFFGDNLLQKLHPVVKLSLCLCSLPFIPRMNKKSNTGFDVEEIIKICFRDWESIEEGDGICFHF